MTGWKLVRRNRAYGLLWAASTGSQFGNWFNQVALAVVTLRLTHSAEGMGFVLLANGLPSVILGPLASPIVDRFPKKPLLVMIDLCRTVLAFGFSLAVWWHAMGIIYIDALLIGAVGALFAPARHAALSDILSSQDLIVANAFSSQTSGVVQVVGSALGGLMSSFSPVLCFSLNALSYLWSSLNIAQARWAEPSPSRGKQPYRRSLPEGLREVRQNRIARSIILIGISWGLAGGGYYILVPLLGHQIYHSGGLGIGVLYVMDGMGLILGGSSVSRWIGLKTSRAVLWYGVAYLTQAAFFGMLTQSTTLLFAALTLLAMRISSGIIIPLDISFLQMNVEERLQGRVFSLHGATYGGMMQLSYVLVGWAFQQYGYQVAGLGVALVSFLCGIFWLSQHHDPKPVHNTVLGDGSDIL